MSASNVRVDYETITHSPWHPHVRLTHEGTVRVQKDIAADRLALLADAHPNAESISVTFGGIPYAGRMNHNVSQ